jgi:catechol 2,3-dioxygenase-like lactoylglutathione lyase family enzyme
MVVELDVSDLGQSLDFYVSALGFTVAVDRPERRFAYLSRDGRAI